MSVIFVFDFDQTLIMGHTGGQPTSDDDYETDDSLIIKLCETLKSLLANNISIYINTRGVVEDVKNYLRHRFHKVGENVDTIIKGVFGAENEEQISNPYSNTLEFWYANNIVCSKLEVANLKDASTRVWAFQKTVFLNKITEQENVDKECVYFFDDTEINIQYAKLCGYNHSFIINNEYSGKPCFLKHTLELIPQLLSGLLVNVGNT